MSEATPTPSDAAAGRDPQAHLSPDAARRASRRPWSPPPGRWPERFVELAAGHDCPMCGNDFDAPDIGWGILLRAGEASNAYLWRSGWVRGYVVVIYTGQHVAEPTELVAVEAAAFWRDVLAAGQAIETFYRPLKMNYLLLGNAIPHAHFHLVPRREAHIDPAPGGPLPFEALDVGRQDEEQLQADAAALRTLLKQASAGTDAP